MRDRRGRLKKRRKRVGGKGDEAPYKASGLKTAKMKNMKRKDDLSGKYNGSN